MHYSFSLINLLGVVLFVFGAYILLRYMGRKRRESEWTKPTIFTIFLWGALAWATDFLLQMTVQDRLIFHLITLPVLVIAWLIMRFYYRVKVF